MTIETDRNQSFWESDIWPAEVDVLIVGGGIVGLHAALHLKSERKDLKILVVEEGWNQQGASTKNAGFVCLGSPSELLSDIRSRGEEECLRTLGMRFRGTEYLREQSKQYDIGFRDESGFEIFGKSDSEKFEECADKLTYLNEVFEHATGIQNQFTIEDSPLPLRDLSGMIRCNYEGNIHPGKWIRNLHIKALKEGINVLRGVRYADHKYQDDSLLCNLSVGDVHTRRIIFATNGYRDLARPEVDLQRVKNQVYLTSEWPHELPGTYHASQGFIYFRKVGQRILIGGARHLDSSTSLEYFNQEIEDYLMGFLHRHLPESSGLRITRKWIGYLGVGESKYPVISKIGVGEYAAVRLGGMGVAIGAEVGKKVAQLCLEDE